MTVQSHLITLIKSLAVIHHHSSAVKSVWTVTKMAIINCNPQNVQMIRITPLNHNGKSFALRTKYYCIFFISSVCQLYFTILLYCFLNYILITNETKKVIRLINQTLIAFLINTHLSNLDHAMTHMDPRDLSHCLFAASHHITIIYLGCCMSVQLSRANRIFAALWNFNSSLLQKNAVRNRKKSMTCLIHYQQIQEEMFFSLKSNYARFHLEPN